MSKNIQKYNQFIQDLILEFNSLDKNLMKSLDTYFTVAIEYEVCANEDPENEPIIEDEEQAIEYAYQQTLLDLSRGKTTTGYGFGEKIELKKFEANLKKLLLEHPEYDKLSFKKKKKLNSEYKTINWFNELMDWAKAIVSDNFDDYHEIEEELAPYDIEDPTEKIIISRFLKNVELFCTNVGGYGQNMDYLKEMAQKKLPNFWKNWSKDFKFELEGDFDKQRILEFSPKRYINGLSEAIRQLEDFYTDFSNQDFWYFNDRTSIHFNVGIKEGVEWNPLKGLLLMGDYDRKEKAEAGKKPHIFKGIEWRYGNRFTGSIIDALKKSLKGDIIYKNTDDEEETKYGDREYDIVSDEIKELQKQIKNLKIDLKVLKGNNKNIAKEKIIELEAKIKSKKPILWNLDLRNRKEIYKSISSLRNLTILDGELDLEKFEKKFNPFIIQMNKDFYIKEFGIKLVEIESNYVEFRYIGHTKDGTLGGVDKSLAIDKLIYCCYIVYLMTNYEYKRKDYIKRLYKFVEELKTIS